MKQIVTIAFLLGSAVLLQSGCMAKQSHSLVKGISDVERTETADDGSVWVWCKMGRSHFGKCKLTMSSDLFEQEVANLCEDNPPAPCAQNGNGGADGPLPGLDFNSCGEPPQDDVLSGITIVFSKKFFAEFGKQFGDLPDDIKVETRKKAFCEGEVLGIRDLLRHSGTLQAFLKGATTGSAVILIIGERNAPVTFDAAASILTLPADYSERVESAIETALAAHGVTFCTGKRVQGRCWIQAERGKSCGQACGALGQTYSEQTSSIAGSAALNAGGCKDLAAAWGIVFQSESVPCADGGVGCIEVPFYRQVWRCTGKPTSGEGIPLGDHKRFCTCN